jgi:hypothetical protein
MKDFISAQNQAESHNRNHDFSHGSHNEGTQSLLAHFAQIGAESHPREGKQESPSG